MKNAVKNASSKKAPKSAVQIAGDVVSTVLVYAMLIIMAFVVLVPIVWIVGASFNEQSSLLSATAFPENPTVSHYVELIKETKFLNWYANTLKIAVVNMVISVVITSLTAYVFPGLSLKEKSPDCLAY